MSLSELGLSIMIRLFLYVIAPSDLRVLISTLTLSLVSPVKLAKSSWVNFSLIIMQLDCFCPYLWPKYIIMLATLS